MKTVFATTLLAFANAKDYAYSADYAYGAGYAAYKADYA